MKFAATLTALIASAATALAASVTFVTLDTVERTIYFTPNPGFDELPAVTVSSAAQKTVSFPDAWIGNYYAVKKGAANVPGMLGEVNFGGWNGMTYFDVSAIVDPNDHDNVKMMWPAKDTGLTSGCEVFPCNNCYWLPDDIQTKVTNEVDLIQTLGSA